MAKARRAGAWVRWIAGIGAVLAVLAIVIAVAVHTPPVRRYALDRAVRTLADSYAIRLRADTLDYNLFALRVTLSGVEVSARDTPAQPFFTARRVTVTVPRSSVFGPFALETVTIDDGRARVARFVDGTSNLPGSADRSGAPAALRLDVLRAPDFAFDLSDEASGVSVTLPSLDLSMAGGHGSLELRRPGRLARRTIATAIEDLRSTIGFDGRTLALSKSAVRTDDVALTAEGTIGVLVEEPSIDVRFKGRGDIARLARWAEAASPPRGDVEFTGEAHGPFDAVQATANLRSPRIQTNGIALADFAASVRASSDAVHVEKLETSFAGGRVSAVGDVPFTGGDAEAHLSAHWTDIDVQALMRLFAPEARPRPAARADGSIVAHGPGAGLERWVAHAETRLRADRRAAGVQVPGVFRLDVAGGRWTLQAAAQPDDVPTTAALRGAIDFERLTRSTVAGTIDLPRVGIQPVLGLARRAGVLATDLPPVAGSLEGTVAVGGTLGNVGVRAKGHGVLDDIGPLAAGTPLSGPAVFTFEADPDQVRLDARLHGLQAEVRATIVPAAPYAAVVDLDVPSIDLEQLLRGMRTPVAITGTARARAHASGPIQEWQLGQAVVDIAAIDARAGALPLRLVSPGQIRYEASAVRVASFDLLAGETHVSVEGSLPVFAGAAPIEIADALRLTVTGDLERVRQAVEATGALELPDVRATGPAALLARITGSAARPVVAADLELGPGTLQVRDLPPVTGLQVRAHANDEWIELRDARGEWQGSRVQAAGRAPVEWVGLETGRTSKPAAALDARISAITPSVLAPFLDAETLSQIDGSVDTSVSVQALAPTLDAVSGEVRLDRMDVRIADLPVAQRVPTRIALGGGLARVTAWEWAGQGGEVTVAGQVRLADMQAALLANGRFDLRMLTPFVRDAGMTTAGTLQPRLSITGTLDSPRVDGVADVRDGEIRVQEPRVIATGLSGRAHFTRTSAQLTDLTGTLNGGALRGTGTVDFAPRTPLDARLSLVANGVAMEFPEGLRSELNADLGISLTLPAADIVEPTGAITGSVTILRSTYREPIALVAGLLRALRTRRAAAEAAAEPSLLDNLTLDVRVLTEDDLLVENNLGRLQLGTDLRVLGTVATPTLAGRAELRRGGRLFLGRNIYVVESGTIDFANPDTVEPDVSIEAHTRAGGEDIVLTLEGTPDTLQPELRSTTSDYGEADLASILLTGRPLNEVSGSEGEIVREQVLGYLSGDVLGLASRAVGLDSIRLGGVEEAVLRRDPTAIATEVDPTTRLTFGKALGPDVDVTFSQDLRDGDAQAWIVDYRPFRNVEARFVSDDDDLRSYGFRHDVSFGGGAIGRPARAAARGAPRRELKIERVDVRGTLVLPERTVRSELRLSQGDDFDFVEWQRDRERLEDLYRREGYDEARVQVDRSESAPGVALTYTIAAGPRTRLVVSGYELDADTRERVRAAWRDSVFDGFLIDEVTAIVRDALARHGYPNAHIQCSFRLQPEDPPPPDEKTLTIAIDPGPRAAAIPTLAAPVIPIEEVRFQGVARLSSDLVYRAAGLVPGAPYDPEEAEAARQRVLAVYRRHGFPRARADLQQVRRDDPPRVALTFLVQEGPQQVITAIDIEGNRGIDRDVIRRALALPLDEPVASDAWLQARRRVFDTGLFRRVDVTAVPVTPVQPDPDVQPVRAHVAVEEWPAVRLRYGFEVAEERPEGEVEGRELAPGLSADVMRRTLFGRALTLGAALQYQRREQAGRAFLNAPTMFGWPIESSFLLERSREEFTAATLLTERSGVSWEQRLRFARNLRLSYAYHFERNHTFDTNPDVDFPFDLTVRVARLTATAAYDTRDDPADTRRGLLVSSSFDYAPAALGTEFRYWKDLIQAYSFRPWRRLVFASAARVGFAAALDDQELLFSERFFAGGSRTVRGAREGTAGPRDAFGEGRGGAALLVLNQEVRFPIYRWVGGVGFVDAGNVFDTISDFDLGDLTGSVGFGLRISTPFALLRVDYGRLLSPGPNERPGRWIFGIGQAF